MEERYRIYNPMGLGGSIQFKATQDIPSRMSLVICDLMGPFMTKCKGMNCHNKIWLLLLLNPSTQFLSIEILQNQSTGEVIFGFIRHMSKYGSKNVFCQTTSPTSGPYVLSMQHHQKLLKLHSYLYGAS